VDYDHGTWYECKFCLAIDAVHKGKNRIRHRDDCEIGNAIKFLEEHRDCIETDMSSFKHRNAAGESW
jgi:hypothetical protein